MKWCRGWSVLALGILPVLIVSCAGLGLPGATPRPAPIAHPTGPDALVLRIDVTGGWLPPLFSVTWPPKLSVYGDGAVIQLGPQMTIYPPPALPNVLRSQITEAGLQRLLREADAAGLLAGDADYPLPGVSDAPTTVFTVNAGNRTSRVTVYALGSDEGADLSPLTPEQRVARQRLASFYETAINLLDWLPSEEVVERDQPYVVTRLQVMVVPPKVLAPPPNWIPGPAKPWPLPIPLSLFGDPAPWFSLEARCGVVSSRKELPRLLEELQTANALTHWESEGRLYGLVVRPLLPDETGCSPPFQVKRTVRGGCPNISTANRSPACAGMARASEPESTMSPGSSRTPNSPSLLASQATARAG